MLQYAANGVQTPEIFKIKPHIRRWEQLLENVFTHRF